MVNTEMLDKKIVASGLKIKFISEALGITTGSFLNKRNNRTEFTYNEVVTLSKLLGLKSSEVDHIFLPNEFTVQ